jgi:hypothetical protein
MPVTAHSPIQRTPPCINAFAQMTSYKSYHRSCIGQKSLRLWLEASHLLVQALAHGRHLLLLVADQHLICNNINCVSRVIVRLNCKQHRGSSILSGVRTPEFLLRAFLPRKSVHPPRFVWQKRKKDETKEVSIDAIVTEGCARAPYI